MTKLLRSAYDLDTPRDTWWHDAACTGRHQLFDGETLPDQQCAAHICNHHCPVLRECTRYAATRRWWGVLAGMVAGWRTPPDPGCGPWCANHRMGRTET